MERTIARVSGDVASGAFTRGAQLVVVHEGRSVLEYAAGDDGVGRAVTPESVFRLYSAIKPILAVAVANVVEAGLLDLDEPLQGNLPTVAALRDGVTARHVLTHTAGVHQPTAPQMEVVPADKRRALLERMLRPPQWQVGVDAGFSEYTGWFILGWLLEALTGEPLREHLRASVLEPFELHDTWVGMTESQHHELEPRIGVSHDLRGPRPMPMLLERTVRWCTETNPAHGGYATATDLARFYAAVLTRIEDRQRDGLPAPSPLREFCSPAREASRDCVLDRVCTFGLGFMTSLGDHAFGETCGPSTFGHAGYLGSSFGFADPDNDLVVAFVCNGIAAPEFTASRRAGLVKSIYADLGLARTGEPAHGGLGSPR